MRQPGQYVDSGGNAYASTQMQRMSGQRMDHKSNNYQPRGGDHHMTSENDNKSHGAIKGEGQWRYDRDASSHMFNEGMRYSLPFFYCKRQGADASRSYYQGQGQRSESRLASEKKPHDDDMEIGFEDKAVNQTFEGLEQRFYDDILKLTKEQNDAEDAENARHRERINAINLQYEEQLAALRTRHINRRDEFLRRESHARQQQYQQAAMEHQYTNNPIGFSEPHGYNAGEPQRAFNNTPHVDSYRERPRFTGGNRDSRDPGFEPRGQYPGGRVYGSSGSRHY
ncbi:hypothetical protein CTI12_AA499410 [Artemisia annua]|uniref:Uncharacterized protein n=1 Tax=Artemisia annua TaxID=35608 RepID=A0A2U1L9W7_ARTAN|nr:hypothetical protein CTI12_AA499410 [Artemisia annua]